MPNPIKVEAHEKFPYKLVEWKLHDKCNYNCSFCGDENKLGKVGWANLETNKKIVDSIIKSAEGKPLWIQITGGEPTLYPNFIELARYIKQEGAYLSIITNGSRTVRWWKEFSDADLADVIYITFHSEQLADYYHLTEVTNLFLDKETIIINVITHVADSIEYALLGAEYLRENTGGFISMNAMDFGTSSITEQDIGKHNFDKVVNEFNISVGKRFENEKKKTSIPPEHLPIRAGTTITYDDGSTEIKDVTQMMKLGENKFKDWMCYAGVDSMNIENNVKSRGGCKRDPVSFTPDTLTFFDKPFACDVTDCFCAMDMITTKIKQI